MDLHFFYLHIILYVYAHNVCIISPSPVFVCLYIYYSVIVNLDIINTTLYEIFFIDFDFHYDVNNSNVCVNVQCILCLANIMLLYNHKSKSITYISLVSQLHTLCMYRYIKYYKTYIYPSAI